ncbi:MAG: hypothetical protein M5U29_01160 [Anaerolineae bacterium]|nr:hypothetical protein [Anaerolineae bacterium]
MPEHRPPAAQQPLSAEELADLFEFAPDALAANRASRLSDRQRQDLRYRSIGHLVRGAMMLVGGAVLIAAVSPLAEAAWERAPAGRRVGAVAGAGPPVADRSARRGAPHCPHGNRGLGRAGDPSHPAIAVNGVTLRVSYRRWKRLSAAYPGRYRAYYGPARTLLSIELAPEEPDL